MKQAIRVLIFEHPLVKQVITDHLDEVGNELGEKFELFFPKNRDEAIGHIPQTDIAIIEVEEEGRHIAHKTVLSEIPTITTSQLFRHADFAMETDKLKLIAKPYFSLESFDRAIAGFLEIIRARQVPVSFSA